jgi:hypothetical protein
MKITQVAGFLGCGKTTLMLRLSKALSAVANAKWFWWSPKLGEFPLVAEALDSFGDLFPFMGSVPKADSGRAFCV